MEYLNTTENIIPKPDKVTNETDIFTSDQIDEITKALYHFVVPVLIILCIASVIINVKILCTVFWVRKPISPTLRISLSLAAADAFAALCIGTGLTINSWLPFLGIKLGFSNCPSLLLEAFRLGGILTTILHLMVLGVNHYLGIVRPLHYASTVTRRYINIALVPLWILPTFYFLLYFSLQTNDGFLVSGCDFQFLRKRHFRVIFAWMFFAPFILMVFIYGHIFIIVHRHKRAWAALGRTDTFNSSVNSPRSSENRQMERNIKAMLTTLLILGSYLLGWLPGISYYVIVCDDCSLPLDYFEPRVNFAICVVTNVFIIMKTIMNPVIYAARMTDIKIATMKMNMRLRDVCKNRRQEDSNNTMNSFTERNITGRYHGNNQRRFTYARSTTVTQMM